MRFVGAATSHKYLSMRRAIPQELPVLDGRQKPKVSERTRRLEDARLIS